MQLTQEMCIQQWLEYAGLTLGGPVISSAIKALPNNPTTDTIHIDLCARSSDMVVTMEGRLKLYQLSPSSPSTSSKNSSPSTSEPSQPTSSGMRTLTLNSEDVGLLYRYLVGSASSGVDEQTRKYLEKQLRTTLNAASPT